MTGRSYDSLHDQAIDEVRNVLRKETDPLYVERYYTPETDAALRSMCDDIRAGYRELISNADWLSEPTRKELLRKLENIVCVTGTDLKRHDNSKYADVYGNNYYEFRRNYTKIASKDDLDRLNEPVSRTDIAMDMQIFNACYNPFLNNITITVAITNAPFFDANADYYTNLGGLGMVIAHEIGHAFDNNGIVFNSKGEYDPSWIPEADMNSLLERNEKAVRYFEDNFTVFGIYHVDGEQTLGENYADLGAMECITSLTKTKEDRIKLFESYATIWCEMNADELIIDLIAYDEHSPALIRVNAVLSTLSSFYETYDVREGDGMYIAPEDRISRWY
jgi:predicted metalloendopeptidase